MYEELTFNKSTKVNQWENSSLFNKLCWKNCTSIWETKQSKQKKDFDHDSQHMQKNFKIDHKYKCHT